MAGKGRRRGGDVDTQADTSLDLDAVDMPDEPEAAGGMLVHASVGLHQAPIPDAALVGAIGAGTRVHDGERTIGEFTYVLLDDGRDGWILTSALEAPEGDDDAQETGAETSAGGNP